MCEEVIGKEERKEAREKRKAKDKGVGNDEEGHRQCKAQLIQRIDFAGI